MPLWLEITVFLLGWAFLAGAGWSLYMKVQRHEALLQSIRDAESHDRN